jgi:hypothetical protein
MTGHDVLQTKTAQDQEARSASAATDRATIMQSPSHRWVGPLSRRATVGLGLSAAIFSLAPIGRMIAQVRAPDALHARFLRWSRTATGFADLSSGAARTCMELLLRSGVTVENLLDLEADTYRGTPFEKSLLDAWYTGVFKPDGSSKIRSFDTTLMWRAAGVDPPPSTCSGGPESWASPPSNI